LDVKVLDCMRWRRLQPVDLWELREWRRYLLFSYEVALGVVVAVDSLVHDVHHARQTGRVYGLALAWRNGDVKDPYAIVL
jgi:hypothetical protein